jgi:hypothetical protein
MGKGREIHDATLETTKQLFIEALDDNLGIIKRTCQQMQISRQTYYNWLDRDPDFAAAIERVKEQTLDFVETALLRRIKDGDTTAIIFYLKCKGKERGYVDKQQFEISNTAPIVLELGRGKKPQ